MTTASDNEAAARRLFEEVWQKKNFDVIDELVADDYVLHDSSMPEGGEESSGPEGFREMAEMGADIIDRPPVIEQLIATDEYVVSRWSQTGTLVGSIGNIEPTNEEVTITGIGIDRFADGKLAETWQEVGMVPMLMQIGVLPDNLFTPEAAADD